MITLTLFMFAAAVAYGVAFSEPIVEFGFLILEAVAIHLYLASAALATAAWLLASTRLKFESVSAHAMGSAKVCFGCTLLFRCIFTPRNIPVFLFCSFSRQVEWLFAFEIQCNAFVPVFVLLYVVQYLLLPLLLQVSRLKRHRRVFTAKSPPFASHSRHRAHPISPNSLCSPISLVY